jgi:hypothetical protein
VRHIPHRLQDLFQQQVLWIHALVRISCRVALLADAANRSVLPVHLLAAVHGLDDCSGRSLCVGGMIIYPNTVVDKLVWYNLAHLCHGSKRGCGLQRAGRQ